MGELRPVPMPRLEHDLDRADPLTSNLREVRPHPDPFAPKRSKPAPAAPLSVVEPVGLALGATWSAPAPSPVVTVTAMTQPLQSSPATPELTLAELEDWACAFVEPDDMDDFVTETVALADRAGVTLRELVNVLDQLANWDVKK